MHGHPSAPVRLRDEPPLRPAAPRRWTATDANLPHADTVAIPGYDRLADTKVIAHLSQLSQKRMEAVETYERARRGRRFVLERLRYPRTDEALEGYDALTAEQMPAALEDADLATVNRVRAYERKLRRRERVLAQIDRVRQQLRGPGNTPGAAPPTRR